MVRSSPSAIRATAEFAQGFHLHLPFHQLCPTYPTGGGFYCASTKHYHRLLYLPRQFPMTTFPSQRHQNSSQHTERSTRNRRSIYLASLDGSIAAFNYKHTLNLSLLFKT
ncbi:unnamed protein product [Periconia digitata]|uniref:Uncharacterized protein n=1 Tax=Periconia digitata TaxID=1303443 RepID=A0A9W4UQC9_9PLEO|nr:unnamed protein product [Periconia digitata]